jgi:tetratricopeptide (TPR) repeat protein
MFGSTLGRWFAFPVFLTAAFWQRLLGSSRERLSGKWTERLNYRLFLQGLPAVLVAATAIALGAMHFLSRNALAAKYSNWAEAALQEKQYDEAVLCLQRLLTLHPGDRRLQFRLAFAYAGQGDAASAVSLMQTLAPRDEIGYPPAQLWLVRRQLSGPGSRTAAELRELESRLIRLRNLPEVGNEAAAVLADIYFRTGRAKLVLDEPTLTAAAESTPELRLPLTQARLAFRSSTDKSTAALRADAEQLAADARRALALRPDDVMTRLRLAQTLLLLNDFDGAEVVLREGLTLADDARLGEALVQAACGRVDQAAIRGAPPTTVQGLARAALGTVSRYAQEGDPKLLATAKLTALAGNLDDAIPLYLKLVDRSPVIRLELAELLQRSGRTSEAKPHYEAILQNTDPNHPPNDVTLCLAYGTAQRRLENFAAARDWYAPPAVKSPAAKQLLVETLIAWSDRLPEAEAGKRLELLQEAVRRMPQQLEAWNRILKLSVGDLPTAENARRALADMIARGDAGAEAYALLGTHALQQNDEAAALKYLEQAERLNPQSGTVLNNLAWLLAFGEKPDLQRALALADAAVLKYPQDERLRDTRGRILAKLERWDAALADLEQCRRTYDSDPTFHRTLAEVYEQLGLAAPAEAHRRRERELKSAPPPPPAKAGSAGTKAG